MGDRSSACIAQTTVRKTAQYAIEKYPIASKIILENCYMDDIPGSTSSESEAMKVIEEITFILAEKGFRLKGWQFSGQKKSVTASKDQEAVQILLQRGKGNQFSKALG